jgi:hypothetical protein
MTPRRAVALAVVAVMWLCTGAGYAYYRSSVVSGATLTAGSTTATQQELTSVATAAAGTTLFPSATSAGNGSLTVRVTNPNSAKVRVGSIVANGAVTGCTTPDVTVVTPTAGLPFTLNAGETRTVTLTGAVHMGLAASSNCQSQTLTIPVLLNG